MEFIQSPRVTALRLLGPPAYSLKNDPWGIPLYVAVGGMTCATPRSWSRRGTATLAPWKRPLRSVRT